MSLIAEFRACSPNLVLGPTLESVPGVEVELERQFAVEADHPIAFCWITANDFDALEEAIERDETIEDFDRIEIGDRRALYRLRRSDSNVVETYRRWMALDAELLSSYGTDGCWDVRMRFPDREAFTNYHEYLDDAGVSFELRRLSEGAGSNSSDDILTDSQREALQLAYENGFFDVPRGTTLGELAETLGISDQAVSERLRRGHSRLIAEHVL